MGMKEGGLASEAGIGSTAYANTTFLGTLSKFHLAIISRIFTDFLFKNSVITHLLLCSDLSPSYGTPKMYCHEQSRN
jgi:hypothetical protein